MPSAADSLPSFIGGFITVVIVDGERPVETRLVVVGVLIKVTVPSIAIKGLGARDVVVGLVSVSTGTVGSLSIVICFAVLVRGVAIGRVVVLRERGSVFLSRISNPLRVRVFGMVLGRTIRRVVGIGASGRYCRATSLVPITLDRVS